MKKLIVLIPILFLIVFSASILNSQIILETNQKEIFTKVNDNEKHSWYVSPELNPDVFKVACEREVNTVWFIAESDSVKFEIELGETIDFLVVLNETDSAFTRVEGVLPNLNFTDEYIAANKGNFIVEIPEVSELANIIISLHKDIALDSNIVDQTTDYYQEVKSYFGQHLDHPIIDTIHKYMNELKEMPSLNYSLFSNESYWYHYAFKMNACTYKFDDQSRIVNEGYIREMCNWHQFDPFIHKDLIEDFAHKSNFRQFYRDHLPYYEGLIETYKTLNPIDQMQSWLSEKFGFTYGNYSVYFSPLVYGAHSTSRHSDNGFDQTFMFIAKATVNENRSLIQNELIESRVVFTEIDHNFVNPVTDKYSKAVNKVFGKRSKWADEELSDPYDTPIKVFNEYMTFAVYSLYVNDNFSQEDLNTFLPRMESQMVKGRGFIAFKEFNTELLETYKANPNKSIEELYEHMIAWSEDSK